MKKNRLLAVTLVPFLLSLLLSPRFVFADGMIVRPDPYSDRWDFVSESNQQAFINYKEGQEKLLISVGIGEVESNAVWIFPVPSNPEKVVIDVVTSLPRLGGEEVTQGAKIKLSEVQRSLQNTQIYPAILRAFFGLSLTSGLGGPGAVRLEGFEKGLGFEKETDVVVHEHLEKEGLTTEVITARDAWALYRYLQAKDLKVESGSIPVLDHYIGENFTFVVSWITKVGFLLHDQSRITPTPGQRGVLVSFPTKDIYYPLLPTSVYGSEAIPITIRVNGFISPKVFKDIKGYAETQYFWERFSRASSQAEEGFYDKSDRGGFKYTKVEINIPSKLLSQDLWLKRRTPAKIGLAWFIFRYSRTLKTLLLISISAVTGVIVGFCVFHEARRKKEIKKFALLGISNFFSILGLIFATLVVRTKVVGEEEKALLVELKKRGVPVWGAQRGDPRKLIFILLFSVCFLLGSWLLTKVLIFIL